MNDKNIEPNYEGWSCFKCGEINPECICEDEESEGKRNEVLEDEI